ncbi:hypothetical protein ALI22I_13430 [Saccharothrix sp. ALI-22-I]|nr:hypothetical protein ALI22I_13430 [Saccharothrix sp. ALI-22-I]
MYSAEVRSHMDRISAADLHVVVFPVWWFAPPAILKGWIDRVWNHGFAYGRSRPRLAGKRMRWIGLAGESRETFVAGMEELMDRQLRVGLSNFCGITDASLTCSTARWPARTTSGRCSTTSPAWWTPMSLVTDKGSARRSPLGEWLDAAPA